MGCGPLEVPSRSKSIGRRPIGESVPSAGEVEQFAYCAHNWWLARRGVEGNLAGSDEGMACHSRLGRQQKQAEQQRTDSADAARWMFRILMAAASATFLTLEVIFLRNDPLHYIFLTTALVLTSASAGLLVIASTKEAEYKRQVVAAGLVPGPVVGQGFHGEGVMKDGEWNIRGAPDYVIDTAHGPIPVKVKTGRTPDSPYNGHELQLACYLRLMEVKTGAPPEYGLLTYPDGVFRLAWNDTTRGRLQATLARMDAALAADAAPRDHEHAGRCIGCARREMCDQKLA
jgi:CRISPR/Cas system-associated exonuclease Cas4 (RecB family)